MLYRHYKGGRYVFLATVETHEHNEDSDVIYMEMTTGRMITRPYARDSRAQDSWTDAVRWPDGRTRARFIPEIELSKEEREACGFDE